MNLEIHLRLILSALAVWRVTHLLAHEDGPADLIVRLRVRLGNSLAGRLMDCFLCLSLWVAAPAAMLVSRSPVDWLLTWLVLSGAACLLERIGKPPLQSSQGGSEHVLWSETGSSAR